VCPDARSVDATISEWQGRSMAEEQKRPLISITSIARSFRLTRHETLAILRRSGIPIVRVGGRLAVAHEDFAIFLGGRSRGLSEDDCSPRHSTGVSTSRRT